MTISSPLTKLIGEAERILQAVLHNELQQAGLSFPEWVALTILSGAGSLEPTAMVEEIAASRVVAPDAERGLLEAMIQKGLVQGGQELVIAGHGLELVQPLRTRVKEITASLVSDLPQDDIDAARRVLNAVTHRAAELLAQPEARRASTPASG